MKPLKHYVILEEIVPEISKVILVDNPEVESNLAKVLQVGSEIQEVKEGDTVLIQKFGFNEIEYEKKKYLIGKEENILAII